MSKEQGTISWCYARGREAPNQKTPPLTCGVRGSAAWVAFKRGQKEAKKGLLLVRNNQP
jgi:hypothetical protein